MSTDTGIIKFSYYLFVCIQRRDTQPPTLIQVLGTSYAQYSWIYKI